MILIKKINYNEKHFRKRTSKQKNDYLKAQEKLLKQYTLNNILKNNHPINKLQKKIWLKKIKIYQKYNKL